MTLRPVSKKRAKLNRIYLPLRAAFLEANPVCQHCYAARSVDVDHITNRSQSVRAFLDQSNWQALCRRCHDDKGRPGSTVRSMPGWEYRDGAEDDL